MSIVNDDFKSLLTSECSICNIINRQKDIGHLNPDPRVKVSFRGTDGTIAYALSHRPVAPSTCHLPLPAFPLSLPALLPSTFLLSFLPSCAYLKNCIRMVTVLSLVPALTSYINLSETGFAPLRNFFKKMFTLSSRACDNHIKLYI